MTRDPGRVTAAAGTSYDPLDAGFHDHPYDAYRHLRDDDPVHRHTAPGAPPFWVLSRFADVWDAVRDPGTYSSASGLTFYPDEIGRLGLAPTLVMLDPPRQTRLRALIGSGFTPRRVRGLESALRDLVRERIAAMAAAERDGEQVDLHRDLSTHLPTFALTELFGVPAEERHRFGPWVTALTHLQDSGFDLARMSGPDAVGEMFAYFGDLVAARREQPGEDLISALVAADVDGERLTDWDILGFCFVMTAGGTDTTANLVSHAAALLTAHPEQRALLLADPGLLGPAVVESLRVESSVQALARTATRDVTLHGSTIREGEKVLLLYGAANRDDREFGPTAEEFDIRREIPRHLGFASGPHFCVGSHLARLMAEVALDELLRAYPGVAVDPARGERLRSAFTRGWVSLPASLAG